MVEDKIISALICPGMQVRQMERPKTENVLAHAPAGVSRLGQWPCQIKLAPVNAPYFNGAKLLLAADCTAYAYANVHEDFMKGKITLIGCPKLDAVDYSEKLTEIFLRIRKGPVYRRRRSLFPE